MASDDCAEKLLNNILGYEAYRLGLINIPFPKPVRGKLKIEKELIHRENEGILEVRTDGKPICSLSKNKCKTLGQCATKFQGVINIVAIEKNLNGVERAMIFQILSQIDASHFKNIWFWKQRSI
jgi:hypothetical protein